MKCILEEDGHLTFISESSRDSKMLRGMIGKLELRNTHHELKYNHELKYEGSSESDDGTFVLHYSVKYQR